MHKDLAIHPSPRLADRTSIGLGGRAIAEVTAQTPAALELLPEALDRLGGSPRILGEGSNIIARDGELPIVLARKAQSFSPRILGEEDGTVLLRVDAGMRLPALLAAAASLGLSGLEPLCGIPGSLGGALAMNAGSYGLNLAGVLHSAEIFSPETGLVERRAEEFSFAYRSCVPPGAAPWFMAASLTLRLRRADARDIRAAMREHYLKKRATQPVTARSAGCVFKNPAPGLSAGKLLDQAGLKGLRLGGMRFSPLHANFLVNEGGGTSAQAEELVALAREKVREHSGHALELEVRLWP